MKRCIQLAKNGLGTTYPNPLVGSVIVHQDSIIGEGWHKKAGEPHAEVNAINSVVNRNLFHDATIYVSLEPCSHYGKTPPCADLIIASGIKTVIIGSTDPNPKVAGKGIIKLQQAGCTVRVGILEEECLELNRRFFTFQLKKRPYIILKWAQSSDGFMAPSQKDTQEPFWISNSYSKQLSHKLRATEQAILVGTNTVMDDDPSLTLRDWAGIGPTRVIIDRSLKLSMNAKVFDQNAKTLLISETSAEHSENREIVSIDFSSNILEPLCTVLYEHALQSVIVEGGARTLQSFIDNNLWDEAFIFQGPKPLSSGLKAPKFSGIKISETNIKKDLLYHYKNQQT